jgi:L,D-transpeptidase YbiS
MNKIVINIASQTLSVHANKVCLFTFPVSTAKNGVGQDEGSEQTPLGKHRVYQKFGENQPLNTVFVGRKATGEIYTPELGLAHPDRDWILTRILWLEGLEPGINQGGNVDTKTRYIYIHGCPEGTVMDSPSSHGCIRMKNKHLMQLFNSIEEGAGIDINL